MRFVRVLAAVVLGAWAAHAAAHEFWMVPDRLLAQPGDTIRLSLAVGENFRGDAVAFSQPLVAGLRHFAAERSTDLRVLVPARGDRPTLAFPVRAAGTHLFALDTHPSAIVLPADKFNAYLRQEGLRDVLAARERAGTSGLPGRERYRRNVKTLLQAGGTSDATHARRTGQRLEIVPVFDPARWTPGEPARFEVLFDAKPLSGALMKMWWRQEERLTVLEAVTDAQGAASFAPPAGGAWMASVVHMVPVRDDPEFDWDSYWGNLTLALPVVTGTPRP